MRVDSTHLARLTPLEPRQNSAAQSNQGASFADLLRDAVNQVNELQIERDRASVQLALGDAEHLHDVMIAAERAQLALEMLVAVQNKLVEAYQEISRMQV